MSKLAPVAREPTHVSGKQKLAENLNNLYYMVLTEARSYSMQCTPEISWAPYTIDWVYFIVKFSKQ